MNKLPIPVIYHTGGGTIYVSVLIEAKQCHICKNVMVRKGTAYFNGGHFPNWRDMTLEKQVEAADLRIESRAIVDGHYICQTCCDEGKADFLCALCNIRRPSTEIKQSFGEPAEYLCGTCYNTVPAKIWEEKSDTLTQLHQYDFE